MPIYAVDPAKTWEFVPEACLNDPAESQTVFLLRALTAGEYRDFLNLIEDPSSTRQGPVGTMWLTTVRYGLAGWKNFATEDGTPVEFRTEGQGRQYATDDSLSAIPMDVLGELFHAIRAGAELAEDDPKN